jgi:hypothetical protein
MNDNDFDDLDELPAPPRKDIAEADRELLELAARAIGSRFEEVDGEGYGNLHFEDGSVVYSWNPLQFSGDTFELAVRLGMLDENATFQHHLATEQSRGGDPLAAAKRAVVLTAAGIGKTMR